MKQVDCAIFPHLIYTVQLMCYEEFSIKLILLFLWQRSIMENKVIHNPFTMQQQVYLKTIQSEFIYAFLSEDYSASLHCKLHIY